jgi:hypothetical protein
MKPRYQQERTETTERSVSVSSVDSCSIKLSCFQMIDVFTSFYVIRPEQEGTDATESSVSVSSVISCSSINSCSNNAFVFR